MCSIADHFEQRANTLYVDAVSHFRVKLTTFQCAAAAAVDYRLETVLFHQLLELAAVIKVDAEYPISRQRPVIFRALSEHLITVLLSEVCECVVTSYSSDSCDQHRQSILFVQQFAKAVSIFKSRKSHLKPSLHV